MSKLKCVLNEKTIFFLIGRILSDSNKNTGIEIRDYFVVCSDISLYYILYKHIYGKIS